MNVPAGVSAAAWAAAVQRAAGDRVRLANLVARGTVHPVRGAWRLPLPPVGPQRNLAIRPKRKRK